MNHRDIPVVQRYSFDQTACEELDPDGNWVKFEDIEDRVGVWGKERTRALKNALMLVEATELLQLMIPILQGHMTGEDSELLSRVRNVLDNLSPDIIVVGEVIATGGPHDAEDRVFCQLVADLPPIGTKVIALSK